MQLALRLIGNQMQRGILGITTQPFQRFHPGGMTGTVVIFKTGHNGRIDFNLAGRSCQGIGERIISKGSQHHHGLDWRLGFKPAGLFELGIIRHLKTPGFCALDGRLVDRHYPFLLIAAFGEFRFDSHLTSQSRKNIVIIAARTNRFDRLLHIDHIRVTRRYRNVIAFECCGTGQDNITMPGHAVPAPLVHHNGIGLTPGLAHLVQILVMMKWVTASPVEQVYVGVLVAATVEFK